MPYSTTPHFKSHIETYIDISHIGKINTKPNTKYNLFHNHPKRKCSSKKETAVLVYNP